jgi:hypothetical protein
LGWPTFLGCNLLLVVLQNVLWVRDTADELLTESNRIPWVVGAGRFDLSLAGKEQRKRWPCWQESAKRSTSLTLSLISGNIIFSPSSA